jgi:molecular chaperone DnaK (HSP70)
VFKNGRVEIIANDQGNRITPSYVAFTAEGERLIGDAAKNQLTTNPENTVFDAKRLIGREWTDASVQHDIKYFPFKVIDKNSKPHIKVDTTQGEKIFAAEEISAMVLNKMKETAEAYLGKKVTHAVVTVPAVSIYKALTKHFIEALLSESSLFNFELSCFSIEYSR